MEELDLKQLFRIFWNKRMHVLTIVVVFILIGAIYSYLFVKPKYQAYTTLLLAQSDIKKDGETSQSGAQAQGITQSDLTLNQKLVSTYSELVKTKNVLREVIKNLRLTISEDTLKKNVSVSLVKETELIKITVTNRNALDAKEIAKIFSQRVSEIYSISNVYIVDEAEEPAAPYNISHVRDIAIFAAIGLVVAIAYVLLANLLDTTVKTAEDIEKELDVSVLASIPTLKDGTLGKGGMY